jgi:hypothetical protein
MKLHRLSLKDEAKFSRFLHLSGHELSCYSFCNIYIWKKLFQIRWLEVDRNLCVFFQDKLGCFLYTAPLGKVISPEAARVCFEIMERINKNSPSSRIENIEERDLETFRSLGYALKEKFPEYLCLRKDLAELRQDKFKSKRASVNYFRKHNDFEYLPYQSRDKSACLTLYRQWMQSREAVNTDVVYRGMLTDSFTCLKVLLDDFASLKACGRVVKVGGKIRGFTFGFPLNAQSFCVLFEVTDLSLKGLAQFIFREFCAELKKYKYINIMDDSGLENLKRVKLSYHPLRLIPAYIATKINA